MIGTKAADLRQLLIAGYDQLKRRLTRRFGSAEVASEEILMEVPVEVAGAWNAVGGLPAPDGRTNAIREQ